MDATEAVAAVRAAYLDDSIGGPFGLERMCERVVAALISPRTVECDCGIPGEKTDGSWGTQFNPNCPSCSGSGRIEKGPIAYLADSLEHRAWMSDRRWTINGRTTSGELRFAEEEVPDDFYRLYRIRPDESPKGGA